MTPRTLPIMLALAGCGALNSMGPDGGFDADLDQCPTTLSLSPVSPVAPVTMVAAAAVTNDRPGTFLSTLWAVSGPAGQVATTPRDSIGLQVSFPATDVGPYAVQVVVQRDGKQCGTAKTTVNVAAPGAKTADLALRYVPLAAQGAPAQADPLIVTLAGAADYELPAARVLDSGAALAGQVTGPAGGLAAYLRLDAAVGTAEILADATGAYSALVPHATYDVLVVPTGGDVAPQRFPGQSIAVLGVGLTLDAGDLVHGLVHTAGGAPVSGARVAVGTGTLPPSIVTTASDGTFSARVRAGAGSLTLTVVPPAPLAGLRLDVSAGVTVAAGAQLDVALADTTPATFAAHVRSSSGVALPGASVTFVATALTPSGALVVDARPPVAVPAAQRLTLVADGAGEVASLTLPRGVYDVLVDPAGAVGEGPFRATIDLTTGPASTPTFRSAAASGLAVLVTSGGSPAANARVVALARGLSGVGAGFTLARVTDTVGGATLALTPGMTYDLVVDPPRGPRAARQHLVVLAATGAPTLSVALPPAALIRGTVVFASGAGQAGVRVEASCITCGPGQDRSWPLAETVTGPGGAFELLVPAP